MNKSWKKTELAFTMKTLYTKAILGAVVFGTTASFVPASIAQEQVSTINLALAEEPKSAKILHIPNGNRLIVEFEVGQDAPLKDLVNNPYVSSLSSQYNDGKLRLLIETRVPVKYGVDYNGKNGHVTLIKSDKFEEIIKKVNNPAISVTEVVEVPVPQKTVSVAPKSPSKINPNFVSSVTPVQKNKYETRTELENINIKANGKSAIITLDMDSSKEPVITKVGNLLVIDLPNVTVGEEFQKVVGTSHLGTVLKTVDINEQRGNGKIILTQYEDEFTFSTYQADGKTMIEVKPKVIDVKEQVYKGKPLTLNFQNMDVRAILQVIADFTGLNIVASDSVSGSMTVRLKDVPWDQALDLILEARNLHQQKNGNVIWIATRQEITEKNKSQIEMKEQNNTLAPLIVRFFELNHYKAEDMKNILEQAEQNAKTGGDLSAKKTFLGPRGSVGVDVRNNTIFVQDTEEQVEEVAKIIKKLDQASKQVLIEAKLVVVDDSFGRQLGSKFGGSWNRQNTSTNVGVAGGGGAGVSNNVWNSPATGGGSIGFAILNQVTGNMLNFELSALEENNRGKVISNPRLLTTNNKKAEIKQGTEIPYVTPGSANSPATVEFKDAALKLGVTPQISPNGRVTMDLEISKDTIGELVNVQGGGQVPSIYTRQMNTQVTVNDGQTVVLGGIYEVNNREDISKVPLFGDIPWVGNLFKHKSNGVEKAELLVFITPKVIDQEDLDNLTSSESQSTNEINLGKAN